MCASDKHVHLRCLTNGLWYGLNKYTLRKVCLLFYIYIYTIYIYICFFFLLLLCFFGFFVFTFFSFFRFFFWDFSNVTKRVLWMMDIPKSKAQIYFYMYIDIYELFYKTVQRLRLDNDKFLHNKIHNVISISILFLSRFLVFIFYYFFLLLLLLVILIYILWLTKKLCSCFFFF